MTDGLTAPAAGNIHARIERWRERLLELSKRNPLVNMRLGERGAVEVLHPAPHEVWSRLFEGGTLSFPWKRDLLGLEPAESGDGDADDMEEQSSDEQAALPGSERPRRVRRKQEESDPREMDLEACRRAPRFKPGHRAQPPKVGSAA